MNSAAGGPAAWPNSGRGAAAAPGSGLARLWPGAGRWRAAFRPSAAGGGAGAAEGAARAAAAERRGPTHLVVLVNGLAGGPSNWDELCEQAQRRLPPELAADMRFHKSEANVLLQTWDGIDRCGQRLADEVRALAAAPENAGLSRISFVCHSMGGLMARYAVGVLFNPNSGTVAGLQPAHFVTLATPHFGCDSDGVAAVPLITWSGDVPLLGAPLRGLLQGVAHATGAALLRRTGEQFFMLDGGGGGGGAAAGSAAAAAPGAGQPADGEARPAFGVADSDQPLLYQMTQDVPSKGLYFFSGLSAFKTRTAYANTDGDHLVGWANSSLRPLTALPSLPPDSTRAARGVVLEDPLPAAWHRDEWDHLQQQLAEARDGSAAGAAPISYQPSQTYATATRPGPEGGRAGPAAGAGGTWHTLGSNGGSSSAAESTSGPDWGTSADEDWGPGTPAAGAFDGALQLQGQERVPSSSAASATAEDARGAAEAAAADTDLEAGLSPAAGSAVGSRTGGSEGAARGSRGGSSPSGQAAPASRAERVSVMLQRLSALPWRRIDVSFQGATWGLAHNNIQVTRRVLNFQGHAVPRHLLEQLVAMERLLAGAQGGSGARSTTQAVACSSGELVAGAGDAGCAAADVGAAAAAGERLPGGVQQAM